MVFMAHRLQCKTLHYPKHKFPIYATRNQLYLSVLKFDAHGVRLVLQVLDLRTDAAQVTLKLAQQSFHTLRKQGGDSTL